MPSPVVYGLLAVGLWSVHATVAALAVKQMSSVEFTVLAYIIGWMAMGWVILRSKTPVWSTWRHLGWKANLYLVLSGPLLLGYYLAFYAGLTLAPAIEVYAIHLLWPVFMALFCDWFVTHKTRMNRREWRLVLFAFIGAAVVALGRGEVQAMADYAAGYGLALLSALCGGLYFPALLNASRVLKGRGISELASFAMPFFILVTSGMIPMAVVYLVHADGSVMNIDLGSMVAVVYTGLGVVVAAELFWLLAMREHRKSTITSLAYLTPFFSALLLWGFAEAQLSAAAAAGIVLIVGVNAVLHHEAPGVEGAG